MAKHIYIAKQVKGLNFEVLVGDKEVVIQFENDQFTTDDDELAKVIDHVMENSGISRFCRKADRGAAEALARRHAEMMKNTGAHKGGVTAGAAKAAMNTELQQRDIELQKAGGDHIKEVFAEEESLILTDEGVTAPSPGLPAKSSLKLGK